MRYGLPLFLSLVLTCSAAAQTLTIGNDVAPGPPDSGVAAPRTSIDLAHPASATGTVTSVRYSWTAAGCAAALKIKFFRRNGSDFTMTAERGPFTSNLTETLTLSPPVTVRQGDLIGITRLTACGTPRASDVASDGFLVFTGDVTGTVAYSTAFGRAVVSLALYGAGTATEHVAGILAVAGSTRGSFGSNWKTALQIFNPQSGGTLTGRLDFRAQGSGDIGASLPYSLGPGQMKAYEDVVSAMSMSGLGSLDLVVPAGQGTPLLAARIYDDGGASGTAGLSEDLIDPEVTLKGVSRVLRRGTTGFLFTPQNPARTRLNVGVRTLDAEARLEITLKNDAGATVRTGTRTYPPNWFEQVDAATFLGAIAGNETVEIRVTSGSVVVYGSTTDNVTNDPAVQFAVVIFSTS